MAALAAGIERLGQLEPGAVVPLQPWEGRHAELVAKVAATATGGPDQLSASVYQAALRAGQVGQRAEEKEVASAVVTPPATKQEQRLEVGLNLLRGHRPDLARVLEPWAGNLADLAARAAAVGQGRTEQLPATCTKRRYWRRGRALSPRRVEGVLTEVRVAGLADEGPAWALKQRELANLVKTLGPALKWEMDREQARG